MKKAYLTLIGLLLLVIIFLLQIQYELLASRYNRGYVEGMLYAYDNIVVCGADAEQEGLFLTKTLGRKTEIVNGYEVAHSTISCEE